MKIRRNGEFGAFMALMAMGGVARADVVETGEVTHKPDGIYIGNGTYEVKGGEKITLPGIFSAVGPDSSSTVLFDGAGTEIILNGAGQNNRFDIQWGTGNIIISGGATVDATINRAACAEGWCNPFIGNVAGSNATLTITGANSSLSTINGFYIGSTAVHTNPPDSFNFGTPNATSNALIDVLDSGTLNTESGTIGLAPTGPSSPSGGEHADATVNIKGAGSSWNINGDAIGWSVLSVGQGNNATGGLNITQGATVNIESTSADAGSSMSIGRADGGTGSVLIDGSSMSLTSAERSAHIAVGRGTGSNGSLSLVNGGSLTLDGGQGAVLQIGRGGGTGSMAVKDADLTVTETGIQSDDTVALIDVGRNDGGNGTLLLQGSNVAISSENNWAIFRVGRRNAGTSGTATIDDSTLSISSVNRDALIQVGREDGASGDMTIKGSSMVNIISANSSAFVQVGRQGAGTSGILNVTGPGTSLTLKGPYAFIQAGRDAGSSGVMNITNGAIVDVSGSIDSNVGVGVAVVTPDVNRPNAGTGSLTISGAGSKLSVGGGVFIGALLSKGGISGSGTVTVRDGGELTASHVDVGQGGILNGNGTITANVITDGGIIAPGNSPGTLTINGDFTLANGMLMLETEGGISDLLDVSGQVTIGANALIKLLFDNLPDSGGVNLDDFFGTSKPLFDDAFLGSAISVITGNPDQAGQMLAVTYGAQTVDIGAQVVPIPAALPLFLSVLGVMGFFTRRKQIPLAA